MKATDCRVQLYLPRGLYLTLKRTAKRKRATLSGLLRDLIRRGMTGGTSATLDPLIALVVNARKGGPPDGSRHVDKRDAEAREKVGRAILESSFVDYLRLEAADELRAWSLCLKLRDEDFSFTDLTSFAVMERLKLREAFTFDEDFRRYGRFVVIPE